VFSAAAVTLPWVRRRAGDRRGRPRVRVDPVVRQDAPVLAILLPPSEGKALGGVLPGWDPADGRFGDVLGSRRRRVARALKVAKGGDQKLLGVGGETLERARQANRALVGAPVLPASERFTGVVWDHLDLATLAAPARARADGAIVVVSALCGLVALTDPVPDHRLKLSVSIGALGRLSTFWRPKLSAVLNDHLEDRLVIDLLPGEHAAAWAPDPSRYDLRRVRLVDRDGRSAGHFAKAAKGRLARALLEAEDPARALARWRDDEFSLTIS
jgi:cytoplasmic iron level regulating protein YaaA (DUF328/UPF0246 family)